MTTPIREQFQEDIKALFDKYPFWAIQDEFKEQSYKLEERCEAAKTLKEAIETGVNAVMIRVKSGRGVDDEGHPDFDYELEQAGHKTFEGYILDEPYSLHDSIEFFEMDTDNDGMTIAIYELVGGED